MTQKKTAARPKPATDSQPKLLSGGNPQIAKGYGEEPIKAYIAAMPGWKSAVGRKIDALISKAVPGVNKAVKWNSPLYGMDGVTWFMGLHCFDRYIKISFFKGAALDPLPPVSSKQKDVRYFHIKEGEELDEAAFSSWVKQASLLPGEKM
ncbi:MAG: DUF1801 domain-containing protein [Mesorhizobium sp.]